MARKGLPTLIRLQEKALEETRKRLVLLEQRRTVLEEKSEALAQELQNELEKAGELATMSGFFGDFSSRIKKQREDLAVEMHKLDRKIDEVKEEMFEIFSELKKYEIALENQKKAEKKKEARRETIAFDEIAARRFAEKQALEE